MTDVRTVSVAVVGVLLAVAGAVLVGVDTRGDLSARLEERADRVAAVLDLQLEPYRSASRAVAALRTEDPTQEEWVERVTRLDITGDLVSTYSTAAATLTTDGGQRTLVIDRVAPMEPNRAALGLDILTRPGAAAAANRALDGEVVAMSDALTLIQEPGDQAGLVIYAPWYGRDGEVAGVTDIVLRGQDFLDAMQPEIGDVGVRVVDPETTQGAREIGRVEPPRGLDESLTTQRFIEPLGQIWRVDVTAPDGLASSTERLAPWLTLAGLLAVTMLVATVVQLLRRREEHARGEVEARTAELVAANQELQDALAARDEVLAVVAHEFRTPITVIRGFAETAAARRADELPPETRSWLERIDQHARRLHTLLDNVLTTARLQTGEVVVEPEVIDVSRLVEAVVGQHPQLAPVELDLPDHLMAMADPAHVIRVLDALLSNAGKYGRPPVSVTGRTDGDEVAIRVHDSGDGVPSDSAERIFTPFEQADRGDTRRSRGVGLGLSVVRDLCERMDGSVQLVAGVPGACFEVRLPRAGSGGEAEGRR